MHLRDRWLLGLTAARLVLALSALLLPTLVAVPGSERLVPVAAFVPLAVAVPAGLALRERLGWLGTARAAVRLRILRTVSGLIADGIVFGTCCIAVASTPAARADGAGMAVCALSCGAAVEGVAYASAIVSARMSWLVAAALGSFALVALPPNGVPLVFLLPPWVGVVLFVLGSAAYGASSGRRPASIDP